MDKSIKVVKCEITYLLPTYHPQAACSTIILERLSNRYIDRKYFSHTHHGRLRWREDYDYAGGFKKFRRELKASLNWLGSENHRDYREYLRLSELSLSMIPYADYEADQYGFCMASTDHEQQNVRRHLKKLGFASTTSEFNSKNETHVKLFFIPMKTLLKTLEN